jgi:apolipoprotein N-acyltransferase
MNGNKNFEFVHKSKLVLGVEKIPFSNWLPFLESLSIQNGGTSGTLGIENNPKILRTANFSFAPLICYESIYGEFNAEQCRKGAEIICIITNDGWWGDTPGYKQHASFAAIRAIENRRSVARSANTGISCFYNQRGERIAASNWWEPTAIRKELNRNKAQSFYTKNGDYLGKLSLLIVSILAIYSLFIRPKKMI